MGSIMSVEQPLSIWMGRLACCENPEPGDLPTFVYFKPTRMGKCVADLYFNRPSKHLLPCRRCFFARKRGGATHVLCEILEFEKILIWLWAVMGACCVRATFVLQLYFW